VTLRELIDRLEDVASDHGDDALVRIAIQPHWPLALGVSSIEHDTEVSDRNDGERDERDVVWIAATEGVSHDEHPYAPRGLWDR
jgi:hypothetical protein